MSLRMLRDEFSGDWSADEDAFLHFGDACQESEILESEPAMADAEQRSVIELSGTDSAKFLHNFCTNDIVGLEDGGGCEAFLTNVKGRILAHIIVQRVANSLWFDCDPNVVQPVLQHLGRYVISEDVSLADRSTSFMTLPVASSESGPLLGSEPIRKTSSRCWNQVFECGGQNILGSWRVVGPRSICLLFIPKNVLVDAVKLLESEGMHPVGRLASEKFRIRHGVPRHDVDLSSDNLAQEAGRTQWAISFRKGCYLGQEPIARLDALGHVNRLLRTIEMSSECDVQPGQEIQDSASGEMVGTVSSASRIKGDPKPVLMGVLKAKSAEVGTPVEILGSAGSSGSGTVIWTP